MAKYNPYKDDDGLSSEILDPTGPLIRWPKPSRKYKNAKPADSQWATGRACPKCANQLKFFQYDAALDLNVLQCTSCALVWFETDLAPQWNEDPNIDDNFNYRNIPPETVALWMKAREEEKKRNGEWLD
jgi:hypothetical protein